MRWLSMSSTLKLATSETRSLSGISGDQDKRGGWSRRIGGKEAGQFLGAEDDGKHISAAWGKGGA